MTITSIYWRLGNISNPSPAITKETSAVDRADLGEDELDIAEAAEEEQSAAGVALLHAAIAEVDEIQPKTLDISAEWQRSTSLPDFEEMWYNY